MSNPSNERFAKLRIDDHAEAEDDESQDVMMTAVVYKKQKSPATYDEHLGADEQNMMHFKALAKYYGVNQYLVNMPERAEQATGEKFLVATPEAHVQSLSAT